MPCETALSAMHLLKGNQLVVFAVLVLILSLCIFTANALVIFGIVKTRQLGSVLNRFFLFLSISDCCLAGIGLPLNAAMLLKKHHRNENCTIEISVQFVIFLFTHFSGFMIVTIAIDRYIHMRYLQRYQVIMTKSRAGAVIAFGFGLSLLICTAYTISSVHGIFQWVNMVIILIDLAAAVTVYIAYKKVYSEVKQHLKRIENVRTSSQAPPYAVAMIHTILFILVSTFVCYIPYEMMNAFLFFKVQINNQGLSSNLSLAVLSTHLLVYLNSCSNAIIFVYKNDPIRNLIKKQFRSSVQPRDPT